jgi:hypothetical protein
MKQLSMDELNKITEAILGAAIEVHRNLGTGLPLNFNVKILKYGGIKRLAN